MIKKIVISHKCKECPFYEWKVEGGAIGWCEPDSKLTDKVTENNHIILKEGIPDWCPLDDN